jgi:ribonuclease P protein component
VVVPRFGHAVVDRNLVKRRLRDLARKELLPTMGTLDIVVRATPGAYGASFDVLRAAVKEIARRLSKDISEDLR